MLGLVASLALAEGAVRVRDRIRGQPYSPAYTEREMKRLVASMTASRLQGLVEEGEARGSRQETRQGKQDKTASLRARKPEDWKKPEQGAMTLHPYLGFDWPENEEELGRDLEYFRSEDSRRNSTS